MKIAVVFGTRPEVIKTAPLIKELGRREKFEVLSISAAQHRQMLDSALGIFGITPDYDLGIMRDSQRLPGIASRCIERLGEVLEKEKPDMLLVQGDTTTAAAAALTAVYCRIETGHIEAGLRSGDPENPFPEEYNRIMADLLSAIHFAPTPLNRENLIIENVKRESIYVTGNTGIDALRIISSSPISAPTPELRKLIGKKFVLVTAHRRENFGKPLLRICSGLKEAAERFPDIVFIYPVHPNPEVKTPVSGLLSKTDNIILTEPVAYPGMVWLLRHCLFCITDSGGIQEEAPFFGKPVLLLRKVTERPEGVEAGTVKIIGDEPGAILEWSERLLTDEGLYRRFARKHNPYGDGNSSCRIADILEYKLGMRKKEPVQWKG